MPTGWKQCQAPKGERPKENNIMITKRYRRQTISDSKITDDVFEKILEKFLYSRDDITNITQRDIIEFSLPLKLSNLTIARLVTALIEDSNATAGSINQAIRAIEKSKANSNKMLNELISKLEGES